MALAILHGGHKRNNHYVDRYLQYLLYNHLRAGNVKLLAEKADKHKDTIYIRLPFADNVCLLCRLGFRRDKRAYNTYIHSDILCQNLCREKASNEKRSKYAERGL